MNIAFWQVLEKYKPSQQLSKKEIVLLLNANVGSESQALFALADQVRQQYHGPAVHLRGIIEFSNYCKNDCCYCGLRCSNQNIERYRLLASEVVAAAHQVIMMGFNTIVLQSGEDPWYDAATICEILLQIKRDSNVAITLSIGERTKEEYRLMYQAGADRFLLKHETADQQLFNKLRPGTSFEKRLICLQSLRAVGFQVGSGNMVGLPGQTVATLAADILLLKQLDVEMAGIGPFIPHPQTPLAQVPPGDLQLTLKTLAVARLALPLAHLPATTAAATLHPQGRQMALACGANVIMPNVTPLKFRKLYQIYPGKAGSTENPLESLNKTRDLIRVTGREIATGRGDSLKKYFR
ncbi:MAG: [FeFe] hydrogenase H-cluster radical SAM maturase HydE [Desulfotomaculum sp.]|nr:[FeFe] hydrogenase H-cluster radical SAM maturase HydE [Desulfotomaculum sp.]MCL0081279.1 [FeFe] hydrogenase H-cluster radical SAM maturase HydE [Peptococcaceae bacterium]